jgi:hypothetical protein
VTSVLGQSFDRDEIASLRLARGDLAGADRLSFLEDRARTANAHPAAKFCSRQRKGVTQDPNQWRIVVDLNGPFRAVDCEADFTHPRHNDAELNQLVRRNREVADAFSGCVVNRIRDRGGNASDSDLAHASCTDGIEGEIRFADKRDIDLGSSASESSFTPPEFAPRPRNGWTEEKLFRSFRNNSSSALSGIQMGIAIVSFSQVKASRREPYRPHFAYLLVRSKERRSPDRR